jgi:hypothetical protein
MKPTLHCTVSEKPVEAIQKCFSFLRDNIHTDKLLVDYLFSQSIFPDEDKDGMKEGKEYLCSSKLLKSILRSGEEDCRRFIDTIKQSQLWPQFKEKLTSENGIYMSTEMQLILQKYRHILLI